MTIGYRDFGRAGEFHHVAPIRPEYAKLPPIQRDVAAAKRLLAEAGYPDGIDLKIDSRADPDWFVGTVQTLVEQLKEAGIRVTINLIPAHQYPDLCNKIPSPLTHSIHPPLTIPPPSLDTLL